MKRNAVTLTLWLVAIYAAICVTAYFGNHLFMYFPDPTRVEPVEVGLNGVNEVEISVPDGIELIAWYAPAKDDKPTILYFHGNGANAASRAPKIEMIRENGFGVFYLNNRGYGGSSGRPREENNVADAIAAYEHVTGLGVAPDKIIAYGESLGSGQAVRLAAARPVAAVVLEAPLTSTVDVARSTYFWLPLGLLLRQIRQRTKHPRRNRPRACTARREGRSDPCGNGLAGLPRSQRAEAD
jgi:uncharacterized protein